MPGGPTAFAGVGAAENKRYRFSDLFGVSATAQSRFSLGLRGYRLGGGSYCFGDVLNDSYILLHCFS